MRRGAISGLVAFGCAFGLTGCGEDPAPALPSSPPASESVANGEPEAADPHAPPEALPPGPGAARSAEVFMPTVVVGPTSSLCEGVAQFEHPDLEGPLGCTDEGVRQEEDGRVVATLEAPTTPLLEVRVLNVFTGLQVFETAATFLALRTRRGWFVELLDYATLAAAGYSESCQVGEVQLHALPSIAPMVRVDFERTCVTDVNWSGSDEDMERPSEVTGERTAILCRPLERGARCVRVSLGGRMSSTAPDGAVQSQSEWGRDLVPISPSIVRLGPVRGDAPQGLEAAGEVELAFDDAARSVARGFSNRCHRLRLAGRMRDARRACDRGLTLSPTTDELGALHYELGRIEEHAGNVDAARARYRRSLEARPANAIVERQLRSVGD